MKTALAAVIVAASGSAALAQGAPSTVSFVARLADGSTPVAGNHTLSFALYDRPAGGTLIWNEDWGTVSVPSDGVLYLDLGSHVPLDTTVFAGAARYLEITLDGNVTDARVLIESVPYALRSVRSAVADNADTLGGNQPSFYQPTVKNGCSGGQLVQAIDPTTGIATCATPTSTTYSAGNGLSLAVTTFSINTAQTQARVTGTCSKGAISAIDQTGATPTCTNAGTALTYNTGTSAFDVNFTAAQARVAACAGNGLMNSIAQNGSPTCIAPGTGLAVSGSNFNVDTTTAIQARVSGTCSVGSAITAINADGTVTCRTVAGGNRVDTAESTTSTTYTDLTTTGPSVTINVPASGNAIVTITANISLAGGATGAAMSFAVNGVSASDTNSLQFATLNGGQASATYFVTGITSGSQTFTAKYRETGGGGTVTFAFRNIIVQPLP